MQTNDLRSNLGDGFGPLYPAPRGYPLMRSVAAVVALIVCVHAGLWALFQRQQAVPDFDGPLASISYSPYARSQHPDVRRPADRRANSRRPQAHRPLCARHPDLFVHRRGRAGAGDRGRVRAQGRGRHLDRQERSAQRAGNPIRGRPRAAPHQRHRDRGRQRDHPARRQDLRPAHRAHPARRSGSARCRSRPARPGTCGSASRAPTPRPSWRRSSPKRRPSWRRRSISSPPTCCPIGRDCRPARRSTRPSRLTISCAGPIRASAS